MDDYQSLRTTLPKSVGFLKYTLTRKFVDIKVNANEQAAGIVRFFLILI
jgi:hypothetical protein